VKTQGRHGEVAADLYTDFPERFAERRHVSLLGETGERKHAEVEEHWFHKGRVVLKFAGIDTITDAEALVGCEVQVSKTERTELEAEQVYVSDLVGCSVSADGSEIGTVAEVEFGAGEAPLLIIRSDTGKEHMVPFAREYLKQVDLAGKCIQMQLPEGLLELDAPLNAEEKRRQHGE
jgi:16S rRNA processing protein RimM